MIKQNLFRYGNLPSTPQFFGRKQELNQIEDAFIKFRRFVITGIDGQGKTSLAIEVARKSKRKICFIDYVAGSSINAIDLAVKTLADVLDSHVVAKGIAEATEVLNEIPTLLIFDNVESIQSQQQFEDLLNLARQWSEVGECRVLITTKTIDFKYYDTEYKKLSLTGLIEKDAIEYFQHIWKLSNDLSPPKSSELLELFKLINFHPLLITMLAKPLQTIQPLVLKENLWTLLTVKNQADQLWLILNFILKGLEIKVQKTGLSYWLAKILRIDLNTKLTINSTTLSLLPRLGVFQNGVFEPDLLEITDITRKQWFILSTVLREIGLIQFENLPLFRVPYIKFHPILAPTLWSHIAEERKKVFSDYQQRYAQLSAYMSYEEGKNTDQVRNLIRRDFSNLIYAVSNALDAKETWAPQFVTNLSLYLTVFGFEKDKEFLTQRAEDVLKKLKK